MTDIPSPEPDETVTGGGGAAEELANDPVRRAAMQLELLGAEAREAVLDRMNPEIADSIRRHIASQPDNRPHGEFSTDVATRRTMINEMANRVTARKTAAVDEAAARLGTPAPAGPAPVAHQGTPMPPLQGGAPMVTSGIQVSSGTPLAAVVPAIDPLEQLRTLHPAAIARAMQGERAEAWAIVLDRLDPNARAALQLYLDASARVAIEDARVRQAELAASSPALINTIETAIARTVVPRAMREHHQLLSTTPLTFSGGVGA